jgi:hypothetical protein
LSGNAIVEVGEGITLMPNLQVLQMENNRIEVTAPNPLTPNPHLN